MLRRFRFLAIAAMLAPGIAMSAAATSVAATLVAAMSVAATPAAAQVTGALPQAALPAATTPAAATPVLKRDVTVSSELVRIGDLVENAGTSARVPIFRAPDLGETGTVSAARVIEALRQHGFTIVETRGVSDVAVTRLSRVIGVK